MNILKLRYSATAIVLILLTLLTGTSNYAQTTYATGFEAPVFTLGDIQGQNGWGYLSNSPTKGVIETVPPGSDASFGAQLLAVRTNDVALFGVQNHLFSAVLDPAGETGSTLEGVPVAALYNHFKASFYYLPPATPVISTRADGRFAELNPSSRGTAAGNPGNRYAQVRLVNNTNTAAGKIRVEFGWYSLGTAVFNVVTVADNLDWGVPYRIDYDIVFRDGLNPDGSANDVLRVSIFDLNNTLLGTSVGSTWETAYKTGSFGGGTTPRAVNGFDFWTQTGPNNALVGYIDNFSMAVDNLAPTAARITIGGRVLTSTGRGIPNAVITLTDSAGNTRSARSSSLGYYRFPEANAGETYILTAAGKGLTFNEPSQVLNAAEDTMDINFIGGY